MPFGPDLQYATEKKPDPLELRIYPGKDATFTLYEDENNGFNYRKGAYTKIEFTYDEATKTLKIGKRQGSFPDMLKDRTFHIVKVARNHGTGIEKTSIADITVQYSGNEKTISLE